MSDQEKGALPRLLLALQWALVALGLASMVFLATCHQQLDWQEASCRADHCFGTVFILDILWIRTLDIALALVAGLLVLSGIFMLIRQRRGRSILALALVLCGFPLAYLVGTAANPFPRGLGSEIALIGGRQYVLLSESTPGEVTYCIATAEPKDGWGRRFHRLACGATNTDGELIVRPSHSVTSPAPRLKTCGAIILATIGRNVIAAYDPARRLSFQGKRLAEVSPFICAERATALDSSDVDQLRKRVTRLDDERARGQLSTHLAAARNHANPEVRALAASLTEVLRRR